MQFVPLLNFTAVFAANFIKKILAPAKQISFKISTLSCILFFLNDFMFNGHKFSDLKPTYIYLSYNDFHFDVITKYSNAVETRIT